MSEQNSLMNIGDLAKPATTLIEKIADATGAIFLPYQIKRVAKAEAEAEKTKTLANIEITELQQRAMIRLLGEETKKQENIENITAKALPELKEDAKPEEIENDWLSNFFDKCKLVSNDEMQSLWAKILAGEANEVGSFSKRTIEIISTLEKSDAELFTKFCGFCLHIQNKITPLIFYNSLRKTHYLPSQDIYNKQGVNNDSLFHLETIGLIKWNSFTEFRLIDLPTKLKVSYFDIALKLDLFSETEISIGEAILTNSGIQLATICGYEKVDGFLELVLQKWSSLNYEISFK